MLFSNAGVAKWINESFEPVWVSLRPVPRVTIDFGNGRVIKRTLHGNIATWICAADGTAIDVLPGIYNPEKYQEELGLIMGVHSEYVEICKSSPDDFLNAYHQQRAEDVQMSFGGAPALVNSEIASSEKAIAALEADTYFNEQERRLVIHRFLAKLGRSKPVDSTQWLYREVLHADLDDPWLGLGEHLFGNYPFTEEDAE